MPTSYPAGLDSLTNPSATSKLNDSGVVHSDQHANANDAIEAIQAELGLNPKGSSATVAARFSTLAPLSGAIFTGAVTLPIIRYGYTSTPTAGTTTTFTSSSNFTQFFTGTLNQTIVLPVTSTLAVGHSYQIHNNSTGTLTVNSSGGNLVVSIAPGTTYYLTCIGTTLTTAADWDADWGGVTNVGTGIPAFLQNPSSANLATALTDEQGSTAVVFSNAPTITDLRLAAGTTSAPSFRLNSGVNLSSVTAGAIEFDGTVLNFTPNTNFGRASLPSTIYTSGQGTTLTPTATGETTAQPLFPTANDTITLPIGTYHIQLTTTITRGATSTTSATARINFGGGGTAVGSFSGDSISSIAAGGATSQFTFSSVALTTDNVVTAANASAGGVYNINISGILRITTAGTFIPKYSLSAALTGATTGTSPSALTFMKIDLLSSSGSAASNGAWA